MFIIESWRTNLRSWRLCHGWITWNKLSVVVPVPRLNQSNPDWNIPVNFRSWRLCHGWIQTECVCTYTCIYPRSCQSSVVALMLRLIYGKWTFGRGACATAESWQMHFRSWCLCHDWIRSWLLAYGWNIPNKLSAVALVPRLDKDTTWMYIYI